ncbi:hypothetical protein [Actinoallomurus sp. CA-150999]|uniref:hypothetical protein n=1 Tax=Actinoallomurus sp. CA-150999 TaxID=3239887 RepID=UPI003D8B94A1
MILKRAGVLVLAAMALTAAPAAITASTAQAATTPTKTPGTHYQMFGSLPIIGGMLGGGGGGLPLPI